VGLTERGMVCACALFGMCGGSASAVMLSHQPPPSVTDRTLRGERRQITSITEEGWLLLRRHGTGIVFSTLAYVLVGSLRAYRDFFQTEIFDAAGLGAHPEAMAYSEVGIAVVVLGIIGSYSAILNSWRALNVVLATSIGGALLVTAATRAWSVGIVGGTTWALAVGAGIFLGYMPIGCVLYDRLLAAAGEQLTTTMLSVLSDAAVTVAVSGMLIAKEVQNAHAAEEARTHSTHAASSAPQPLAPLPVLPPVTLRDDRSGVATFFASACTYGGVAVALCCIAALVAFNLSIAAALRKLEEDDDALIPGGPEFSGSEDIFAVPLVAQSLSSITGVPLPEHAVLAGGGSDGLEHGIAKGNEEPDDKAGGNRGVAAELL